MKKALNINSYDLPVLLTQSPIEGILGVWKLVREQNTYSCRRSLPGHVLHLVISGSYSLKTNGRSYDIKAGDVIYYNGTELVEWVGDETKVVFYSVGFVAPKVIPLPIDTRVFKANSVIKKLFDRLYSMSIIGDQEKRVFGMHAVLNDILFQIKQLRLRSVRSNENDKLWWELEETVRNKRLFHATLDELSRQCNYSQSTVVRACRKATGKTPKRCLQAIRMDEARGLLLCSSMNITEISEFIGYPRIHEFSREFTRYFGLSPNKIRKHPKPVEI